MLDRPQRPVNVTVRCWATAAEISWWPGSDGHAEITSYVVHYSSSDTGPQSYHFDEGNNTSTLVPVKPWRNYTFSVQAFNEIGESDTSEPVHCTTLPAAPFQHPRNVCTETRLSNQLVIIWQVRTSAVQFSSWKNNFDYLIQCDSCM